MRRDLEVGLGYLTPANIIDIMFIRESFRDRMSCYAEERLRVKKVDLDRSAIYTQKRTSGESWNSERHGLV